jgi:predicted ester cyclase
MAAIGCGHSTARRRWGGRSSSSAGREVAALQDGSLTIDDVVAEGDRDCARFTLSAVHRGDFMGVRATGRSAALTGITILRFDNGACVERWNQADMMGLLQQIGAIPAPAQSRSGRRTNPAVRS